MKLANEIAALLQKALDMGMIPRDSELGMLAVGKLTMWTDGAASEELIAQARENASTYGDGYDVEVDDDAQTSEGDTGTWVSGWVYVYHAEDMNETTARDDADLYCKEGE